MDASTLGEALGVELAAECLRRLRFEWGLLNWGFARGRLRAPVLAVDGSEARLGAWDRATRTITIARAVLLSQPWGSVVEVLKHEMAHQYVDEVLRLGDLPPHGAAFQRAARIFGTEPRATCELGVPLEHDARRADLPVDARLRRARRLLALAESPNVNEAEAALAKAHELLLKYNIDAARARGEPGAAEARYAFRRLGRPTGRRGRELMILGGLLADHFFVETIWVETYDVRTGGSGRVLEICGTPENVALAEHAFHELLRSGDELWRRHRDGAGVGSDRDRRRYVEGVLTGYGEKLRTQRREEAVTHALVWLGDPGLAAFFKRRHPRVRSDRYSVSGGEAFAAGREAGRQLRLRRALGGGGGDGGGAAGGRAGGLLDWRPAGQ